MNSSFLHNVYSFFGSVVCRAIGVLQDLRDVFSSPRSNAILFVAHPDDDALFFHAFILKEKPYVVLLFTGWSLHRLLDFLKAMKRYGVRCRVYDTLSKKAYWDPRRREKTRKNIEHCLKKNKFSLCATHNATGEYSHSTHRLVHEEVVNAVSGDIPIINPVDRSEISQYPLSPELLESKRRIFLDIYKSEQFVMTQYKDWFENEKLV